MHAVENLKTAVIACQWNIRNEDASEAFVELLEKLKPLVVQLMHSCKPTVNGFTLVQAFELHKRCSRLCLTLRLFTCLIRTLTATV